MQQVYILIAIIILAIIVCLMFWARKIRPNGRLSKLASLAFVFIIAGIIFGESRLIGYGLMGIGLVFAFIDIVKKFKNHDKKTSK